MHNRPFSMLNRSRPTLLLARSVVAILFATSTSAFSQIPQALIDHQPSIAVTKQTGTFGGQSVAYTTIVEENILKGADSVPNAFLVARDASGPHPAERYTGEDWGTPRFNAGKRGDQ